MKKYRILIIGIVILIVTLVFAQPPIQPIVNFFLDLEDTPLDYTGDDGKIVKVDEANKQLIFEAESGAVEDDAYGAGWNGDTTNAPSQNATYDILHQYDTDDDGDIDNIDGAVGGGDITGVGPGALAAGDALTDGYVTTGTTLFIWEGTSDDGNEFSIIVPEDPGADIVITMPTSTATLNAAGDITGTDAGTDLTADLEEEVTEGSLADSTIVSADIKNGEVALVDLAAAAYAKDIVTTSPITGGTDNVLVGADSDVTIAIGNADDDGATKGAASFDNTDFDAVAGNVTIVDDGHAHTGTSISGVDISADTNLAVGTGITLTDDTLTATEEDIEDFVGGMLGGTETHISITYQDASNDIDFVVDPDSVAGSISAGAYNDDSVNDNDINWGDISYLTTNGAAINEAYAAGWNADVGPPEKDDVYDYLHLIDTDDDGDVDNIDGSIAALLYETELDDLSELTGQIADVTAFITDDDMPAAGTDPDVDAAGEIGRDTDGANETGDSSLRGHDGSGNQFLYSKKIKHLVIPISNPDALTGWTGRANTSQPVWFNSTGMTFTITEIYAISDADNYDFNLFESNSATDMSDENDTLIDLVECETDGTEGYTDTETTISHAAIEHDHAIIFEHSDGDAGGIIIVVSGWLNADVN